MTLYKNVNGERIAMTASEAKAFEASRVRVFSPADVKAEAARRIEEIAPIWRQVNAMRAGDTALFDEIDAIRSASDRLEAMDPIPDPATWDGW